MPAHAARQQLSGFHLGLGLFGHEMTMNNT